MIPKSKLSTGGEGSTRAAQQWAVSAQRDARTEVNLVGYTVDEAIPIVDRMIDSALVNGYQSITVVHGMGSGTLKRAIRKHLGESVYVKSFTAGGREGENDGVTIVEL